MKLRANFVFDYVPNKMKADSMCSLLKKTCPQYIWLIVDAYVFDE